MPGPEQVSSAGSTGEVPAMAPADAVAVPAPSVDARPAAVDGSRVEQPRAADDAEEGESTQVRALARQVALLNEELREARASLDEERTRRSGSTLAVAPAGHGEGPATLALAEADYRLSAECVALRERVAQLHEEGAQLERSVPAAELAAREERLACARLREELEAEHRAAEASQQEAAVLRARVAAASGLCQEVVAARSRETHLEGCHAKASAEAHRASLAASVARQRLESRSEALASLRHAMQEHKRMVAERLGLLSRSLREVPWSCHPSHGAAVSPTSPVAPSPSPLRDRDEDFEGGAARSSAACSGPSAPPPAPEAAEDDALAPPAAMARGLSSHLATTAHPDEEAPAAMAAAEEVVDEAGTRGGTATVGAVGAEPCSGAARRPAEGEAPFRIKRLRRTFVSPAPGDEDAQGLTGAAPFASPLSSVATPDVPAAAAEQSRPAGQQEAAASGGGRG